MDISKEFSNTINRILKLDDKKITQQEKDIKDLILLAVKIAKSYVRTRVELEDLIMVGIIGILKARKSFDPTRSSTFKSYAYTRMLGEMYSYCHANDKLLSIPTHITKVMSYINKIHRSLGACTTPEDPKFDVRDVVNKYYSVSAEMLPIHIQERICYSKDRIKSIAENSSMTYEDIVSLCVNDGFDTVSESVLESKCSTSPLPDSVISTKEIQQALISSIGDVRFMILKLHTEGYTNPEIADKIVDIFPDIYNKKITRAAVKSVLDNTIKAILKTPMGTEKYMRDT